MGGERRCPLALVASPFGDESDRPLEFAACLADQERLIIFGHELEVAAQNRLKPLQSAPLGKVFWRGEVGEPGAGGGEDELSTRVD